MKTHQYVVDLEWTGNQGNGTAGYRTYERSHHLSAPGRPVIQGSSDPAFRGDKSKYSPEELLVASVSACHMLWYLHLCADAGVIVVEYQDAAKGVMVEDNKGSGRFEQITLYPQVTVSENHMVAEALRLHEEANRMCFIANSLNFRISHTPTCKALMHAPDTNEL